MALSKKPPQRPAAIIPESEVEALINKGGGVPPKPALPATPKKTSNAPQQRTLSVLPSGKVPVQLRLDPETVEQIDALIRKRLVPVSRHVWLMEAVMEKIKRESE